MMKFKYTAVLTLLWGAGWVAATPLGLASGVQEPLEPASRTDLTREDEDRVPARPPMITLQAESAIERAQAYLASTQTASGAWRGSESAYPGTVTALAGLALMAGGNTPVSGKYAANVRLAVDYLVSVTQEDGLTANRAEESRPMYSHGFSLLFLSQAHGMEPDPDRQRVLGSVLARAVKLTESCQSRDGGWYYTPEAKEDEGSVTITQIQGLRACRDAGIHVKKSTIDRACEYINLSSNKDGGVRYQARGGRHGGESRPSITAAAVAVMYNAGQYEHPVALNALRYTQALIARRGIKRAYDTHGLYTWLYLSQIFFLTGDELWEKYFPEMREVLLRRQLADGSWNEDGLGPTYGTAIGLLILQLPYQSLPILQR